MNTVQGRLSSVNQHGDVLTKIEHERFEAKVDRSSGHGPNGDCHVWTAARSDFGYGVFQVAGRLRGAHRVAWSLAAGAWPEHGMCVLHACDNPSCVNPAHLWLGTKAENNADMVAKGRHVGTRRLTLEQVADIRALKGRELQKVTAVRFGVRQNTVSRIQNGKRWAA